MKVYIYSVVSSQQPERMTSVSRAGSTLSRKSKSQALLHKIKNQQRKIKAKAMGISNVISHMDITANPKAVARASEVQSQIEESRREYQSMLDEAFETLGGDAGLTEAMVDDEKQRGWIIEIEAKMEEFMIMGVKQQPGKNGVRRVGKVEKQHHP